MSRRNKAQEIYCDQCSEITRHDTVAGASNLPFWREFNGVRALYRTRECSRCKTRTPTVEIRYIDFNKLNVKTNRLRKTESEFETLKSIYGELVRSLKDRREALQAVLTAIDEAMKQDEGCGNGVPQLNTN